MLILLTTFLQLSHNTNIDYIHTCQQLGNRLRPSWHEPGECRHSLLRQSLSSQMWASLHQPETQQVQHYIAVAHALTKWHMFSTTINFRNNYSRHVWFRRQFLCVGDHHWELQFSTSLTFLAVFFFKNLYTAFLWYVFDLPNLYTPDSRA